MPKNIHLRSSHWIRRSTNKNEKVKTVKEWKTLTKIKKSRKLFRVHQFLQMLYQEL